MITVEVSEKHYGELSLLTDEYRRHRDADPCVLAGLSAELRARWPTTTRKLGLRLADLIVEIASARR